MTTEEALVAAAAVLDVVGDQWAAMCAALLGTHGATPEECAVALGAQLAEFLVWKYDTLAQLRAAWTDQIH